MPEIARFKSYRIWRRPLLLPAVRRKHVQKRLLVSGNGLDAEPVVFEKQAGVWIAALVPPIFHWMRGMRAQDFRMQIEADGYSWKWE